MKLILQNMSNKEFIFNVVNATKDFNVLTIDFCTCLSTGYVDAKIIFKRQDGESSEVYYPSVIFCSNNGLVIFKNSHLIQNTRNFIISRLSAIKIS